MSKREKWQGDTTDHARPNTIKRHKTAIEQEMEEAEEYERRKETEQRRAQEIKLLSQDDQSTPAKNPLRNTSRHCDDKCSNTRDQLELESSSKIKISPTEAKHQLDPNLGGGSMQGFDNALTENGLGRQRDSAILGCEVISKLRLPRSLLEKWVEEPFFEKAVVGCFVRLGVGMAPGTSEPQYKVCEIASVGKYKHAYSFGEFETTKALMLRIGRNQRLWRMNVISNHRSQIYVSWLLNSHIQGFIS
mmetsp:Transcript_3533/g.10412  ORF Transcript_3533/g.10412 Transcript_3533/m.10412 type:complete len:247 (-) Transcript_3533:1347-2087(-)